MLSTPKTAAAASSEPASRTCTPESRAATTASTSRVGEPGDRESRGERRPGPPQPDDFSLTPVRSWSPGYAGEAASRGSERDRGRCEAEQDPARGDPDVRHQRPRGPSSSPARTIRSRSSPTAARVLVKIGELSVADTTRALTLRECRLPGACSTSPLGDVEAGVAPGERSRRATVRFRRGELLHDHRTPSTARTPLGVPRALCPGRRDQGPRRLLPDRVELDRGALELLSEHLGGPPVAAAGASSRLPAEPALRARRAGSAPALSISSRRAPRRVVTTAAVDLGELRLRSRARRPFERERVAAQVGRVEVA